MMTLVESWDTALAIKGEQNTVSIQITGGRNLNIASSQEETSLSLDHSNSR